MKRSNKIESKPNKSSKSLISLFQVGEVSQLWFIDQQRVFSIFAGEPRVIEYHMMNNRRFALVRNELERV